MLHSDRYHAILDVSSADELSGFLIGREWSMHAGFRIGGYLWLNDSTGPDRVQEYAVIRESDGLQVESVTVSWCNRDRLAEMIGACCKGEWDDGPFAEFTRRRSQ